MRKNTKGFTLIELLAVIVILAVIALIAVPIVINIMNNARKSAAADTAYTVRKVARMYHQMQQMSPEYTNGDITITFGADDAITVTPTSVDPEIKYELDGTHPTAGSITINGLSGEITGSVTINGYECPIQNTGAIKCGSSTSAS